MVLYLDLLGGGRVLKDCSLCWMMKERCSRVLEGFIYQLQSQVAIDLSHEGRDRTV